MRGMTKSHAAAYRIGELAQVSGLTPDALRYYERLGLLRPSGRTEGGFRVYGASTVERLRVIKQAQALGLSLREIRDLVSYPEQRGVRRCRHVRDLLLTKLAELEAHITQLEEFRRTLVQLEAQCERTLAEEAAECPVIETLENE